MWTSYEALCELGAVDVDPTSVFGVRPSELDEFNDQLEKQKQDQQQNFPLQERSLLGQSSFFSHHPQHTPFDSVKPLQPVEPATPSSAGSIPKASLFQTAHKRTGPKMALQFETPNFSPIPIQDASFAPHQHAHPAEEHIDTASFVDSANPNTIRRAKNVAARLYYPPSPETPDSTLMDGGSRFLRGMGRNSIFSFTTTTDGNVSETPLRRGGGTGAGSRLLSGIDTSTGSAMTARKPRALFLSSENKTNNTKPERDDDDEPDMQDEHQDGQQEKRENSTTATLKHEETAMATDDPYGYTQHEDQLADEHSGVQEILELLCVLGAAWWRLCQVRFHSQTEFFIVF